MTIADSFFFFLLLFLPVKKAFKSKAQGICFSSRHSRALLKQTSGGSWIKKRVARANTKQLSCTANVCSCVCLHGVFVCVCVDRWCTSRARKSRLRSSRSSPCSWTSSLRRSARFRRRWRPWWLASLSRATPLKPSRRCVSTAVFDSQIWLVKRRRFLKRRRIAARSQATCTAD